MSGAPKFSLSLGGKKPLVAATKAAPAKALGKRPRAAFLDDGVADDDQPAHQEISGLDAQGTAIQVAKPGGPGGPLVIHVPPNSKRQKSSLPHGHGQQGTSKEEAVKAAKIAQTANVTYGLNVPRPRPDTLDENATSTSTTEAAPVKEKTDDERALEALITGKGPDTNHVIPAAVNEDEAYSRDYTDAPDVPTQADYDAIPIEQFGAALLRGMGWKDGQGIGKGAGKSDTKIKITERRPAMLGVGAAPQAALGIEIGAWGKKDAKGKKTDTAYNPVVLKNKITGETITEDELKVKLAEQAKEDLVLERGGGKPSKLDRSNESRANGEHRRDRETDKYYDEKKRSSRRDRSTSYDNRRRERSYSPDRGIQERKEKRRDRSRDDRDHRDRDRSRDRRHRDENDGRKDREREKRRERDPSRDRRDRYDDKRSKDSGRDRERDRDRRRYDAEDEDRYRRKESKRDYRDRR